MEKSYPLTDGRRIQKWVLSILAPLFFVFPAFSQTPPPNDNYSNSITLAGTNITFSGTLAGATLEDAQETITEYDTFISAIPTESVWWNWTAPEDMMLTLEIVNTSFELFELGGTGGQVENCDGLFVYTATNGSTTPAGLVLPALGYIETLPGLAPQTVSVPVTGGSNYQIQLIGNSSANYTFHLYATKTPVIITQPRSQTVYSNAAVTFYVVYAGVGQAIPDYSVPQTNFTFQWYFNGTNLPGETAPMLALTNIDSTMAGTYTVAVGNSAGATLSASATLTVSKSNFPVSFAAIDFAVTNCFSPSGEIISDAFWFNVNGEVGRSYRLQASSNLMNWSWETDFEINPAGAGGATSVFFQTNLSQVLASPNYTYPRFFRVVPYLISDPHAEICVNNLRQIRIAKMLWQRDYANSVVFPISTPWLAVITQYFPHQTPPFCPDDGSQNFATSYLFNNLQVTPVCQINSSNHVLIDPR